MITQEYDLNLVPGGPLVIVHVSQYDDDSRNIIFSLYSGIKKFDVPVSAKVTCNGTKKDNKGFSHEFAFSGNKVTVKPTEDMTAVGGETVCEIVIENNGERLGTANFILMVEDGALGDGTDMSPSDVAQAYDILEKAAKAASDAQEMADHPNVPKNGMWWKWDKESGQYVDTHQRSVLGIDKIYPSFDDMEADKGNRPENTVSIIQSNVDDENNAKLYIHNGSDWVYLADLSGFTGVGIESIELTDGDHSPGTYDTYTITMDNGDTSTFVVWNGETGPRGDSGFSPTVTTKKDGKVTTVTITDADGQHIATILDGEDGAGQVSSVNGKTGEVNLSAEDVDAYTKEETDDLLKNVKVEVDETPTEGSQNPVSSGGVYEAVQGATSRSWEITVSAEGWTEGTDSFAGIDAKWQQTVDAVGVTEDTVLSIDRSSGFVSGDYSAASAVQWYIRPGADTVTVWAPEQTTGDFTVRLTEVR